MKSFRGQLQTIVMVGVVLLMAGSYSVDSCAGQSKKVSRHNTVCADAIAAATRAKAHYDRQVLVVQKRDAAVVAAAQKSKANAKMLNDATIELKEAQNKIDNAQYEISQEVVGVTSVQKSKANAKMLNDAKLELKEAQNKLDNALFKKEELAKTEVKVLAAQATANEALLALKEALDVANTNKTHNCGK